jgi:DNA helicase-2/ATP-dependent DNA helicase PcrA
VNDIQEIVVNSRSAQYSYLLKVAANVKKETAVLYRDNESAIPMIDLLERHGVPYQIRAIDPTFFSHRIIQDISAIIRFALDPYDTDAFMQIYYKLTTYLNKATALAMVNLCKEGHGSVWDALDLLDGINGGTRKSCRAVQSQMNRMLSDRANTAIYRIDQLMGYGEYLERTGIKTNKIAILQAIGAQEESAEALLRRLSELSEVVKTRRAPENCKFILSTIHSAKGLEYDTVYLVDVVDGIFPETVVTNPKLTGEDELKTYEEDRRLFYVGVTRAKNHLKVFTYTCDNSSFCEELLQKKQLVTGTVSVVRRTESEFEAFCKKFEYGSKIFHKAFGRGLVLSKVEGILLVQFEDGTTRRLALDVLFRSGLLIEE